MKQHKVKSTEKDGRNIRVIGIDPDSKKSGFAIVDIDGEILELESMSANDIFKFINSLDSQFEYVFAVEDINKHSTIYQSNRRGGFGKQAHIAQSVGKAKGAEMIITDLIKDAIGKPPVKAPLGIGKQVKRNAKLFKELTGWQGRTNEDTRDAACIARWVASEIKKGWVINSKTGKLVRPER